VKPDTTSYAMFSIMDFVPILASIVGTTMPTDQPIEAVDQSNVLFGKSARNLSSKHTPCAQLLRSAGGGRPLCGV
jgi:hypothetical protein